MSNQQRLREALAGASAGLPDDTLSQQQMFLRGDGQYTAPPPSVPRAYVVGDSLTPSLAQTTTGLVAGHQVTSPVAWAALTCGGRVRIDGNISTAGAVTADLVANQLQPAIAASPKVVIILNGSNDASTGVPASTTITNLTTIYSALTARGIIPIACSIPPNNSGFQSAAGKINSWMSRYCRENGIPFADLYTSVVDNTTGNFVAANTSDGVHFSAAGAKLAGAVLGTVINNLFPNSAVDLVSQNADPNGQANPLMYTDSNADGVPDSFTTSGAGGTYALGTDTAVLGKVWSITRGVNDLVGQSAQLTASPGDRIYMAMKVRATVKAFSGTWGLSLATWTGGFVNLWSPVGTVGCTEDTTGFATIMGEAVMPAGQTGARIMVFASTAASSKVECGQFTLRNLTTLGLV